MEGMIWELLFYSFHNNQNSGLAYNDLLDGSDFLRKFHTFPVKMDYGIFLGETKSVDSTIGN